MDGGILVSQDPEWLQADLNIFIVIFRRIGLVANVFKSKKMMFHPISIISWMSGEAFGWCSTG